MDNASADLVSVDVPATSVKPTSGVTRTLNANVSCCVFLRIKLIISCSLRVQLLWIGDLPM